MASSSPSQHRSPFHRAPAGLSAVLAIATLVSWLPTSTALSQEQTRHGIFVDTIDVHLINIEVVATDPEGRPVSGLSREDFEVTVDGKPVEITNFYEVSEGHRAVRAADTLEPRPAIEPATPEPVPDPSFVVLFIDNGNIFPANRKRVFDDLREHLKQLMEPADRVMVVAQDGELTVEQPFTSDREQILAALERQQKSSGRGNMLAMEPRLIQKQIESGQAPPGGDSLGTGTSPFTSAGRGLARPTFGPDAQRTFSDVASYAQSLHSTGALTLATLSRFVGSLAGLPGRKAILYVSDGLELAPAEALFRLWDDKYHSIASEQVGVSSIDSEIDRYRLSNEFENLIAQANTNQVAFYTVEGGGDRGLAELSAESRAAVVSSLARTADGERQESLRALAYETGGVPLLGQGGIETLLQQLDRDLSNYYSLGYPSPHRGDGKLHRVEVTVRQEGVKARFLEAYRDKSGDERMADQTLAALLHDVGSNPLDVQVEIGKETPVKGESTFVVPVLIKIPMSKLVLIPQDQAHLGRLSIFIAVADAKGRLSDPQKIDVPVEIPNGDLLTAMEQTAGYAARIQMRPGEQKLAIGVRDELAAVDSTLNLDLQVGDS